MANVEKEKAIGRITYRNQKFTYLYDGSDSSKFSRQIEITRTWPFSFHQLRHPLEQYSASTRFSLDSSNRRGALNHPTGTRKALNDNSNVRVKLFYWWLLYVSVYVAIANRTLDIGPDLEAVILGFIPLVVPHELYHGRHLLAIILSVCWKEACVQGPHIWLKDGFEWTFAVFSRKYKS